MVFYMESLKNKRSENQDNYCHMEIRVNHEAKVNAFCIADGMGGLDAGDVYSKKAVSLWFEELVHFLMSPDFLACDLKTQIDGLKGFSSDVFRKLNRDLYAMGMDAGYTGGTTLSTAIHFWDTWIIANCGDSPIYMMIDGNLELVSEIQNVAWQMIRENKTQIGSTLFYQNKNRLLQFLGRRDEVKPYVRMLDSSRVENVLIGTDGAFGDLSIGKIESILLQFGGQSKALSLLLEYARERGEKDNQTAIYIHTPIEKKEDTSSVELPQMETIYREVKEEPLGRRFLRYLAGNKKGGPER